MFEFEGFGKRLQALRKQKNMTQEDMADRAGVSPQAVSKWENDQSYPDITLIPTVATILGTDINYLFGKKEEALPMTNFPATFEGLSLVHSTGQVACYSNKTVSGKDETGVKFTDGSTAELSTRLAVNNGTGEIRFLGAQDAPSPTMENYPPGISTQEFTFGYTENINIAVIFNTCELVHSHDDKTHVTATGEGKFMARLQVELQGDTLVVKFKESYDENFNFNKNDNKITIALPCQAGNHAKVQVNGSGAFASAIGHFNEGNLSVNGSGDITMHNFEVCKAAVNGSGNLSIDKSDTLEAAINGSGDIACKNALITNLAINGLGDFSMKSTSALNVSINGSGDVDIADLSGGGDFSARIQGSGDIKIDGGSCEKFDVDIGGSGEIDAANITARKANIILRNSGEVTLGRVLESSTEQIKQNGKITILKRGAEN
ncbi:MAG: DUF2807 domain-containing protein [Defluviitaleaceae bacterium]|nr:DUF2807 domain-containing protein [Defluviitaleaceae bacterium]MCL2273710.1 DUF2807 domain-containing protein [Defluviitaleaceae bacterium]